MLLRLGHFFRGRRAFYLARSADVAGIGRNRIERYTSDVGITLDLRIDRARSVADSAMGESHPAVQPGAAAEPTDDWDSNRGRHRGTHHGSRVSEIE